MTKPVLQWECDIVVRDVLCGAIREFAHAAYPAGDSDCAQVARYTLMDLAVRIEAGIAGDAETVLISRRPRAQVKSALNYYFDRLDQQEPSVSSWQRELLVSILKGLRVTTADLQRARQGDRLPVMPV